ncbi:MAG: exodeoxyribonuclease VII large subunit [Azospira oryzae]|jgi:exodeoxyribonuclease VII large subunit|nr:MAG: exodeoxyribonuclease VII large subunit [Azospira oryzae]
MPQKIKLSELVDQIRGTLQQQFAGEVFWITSEITNVKPQDYNRPYRFITFIEKEGNATRAQINGVFWSSALHQIDEFERITKQSFVSGLELTCKVRVSFNNRYGLQLEVLEIDCSYALGKIELQRQQTIDRLVTENAATIKSVDGQFITFNNSLRLPDLIQRIALITAPNSDGQRDFNKEIQNNKHEYAFAVTEYLTQIQGDNAHLLILQQLKLIEQSKEQFDLVAIVRGGGSQTDFKPFDEYELCRYTAAFPIPILTGIGHDRNTSIVDLLCHQHKTPTKVATYIIDRNFSFEAELIDLKERFFDRVKSLMEEANSDLKDMKRLVKSLSPSAILNRGFAMITINDRIITDPAQIHEHDTIQTVLRNEIIHSTVTKKSPHERPDL